MAAGESAAGGRPNVVLILVDDLGYGDVGCYGATRVKTPNIDRLAREGRRFTDAHSASAVCTPSRYSLLTGEYAFRRGIFGPVMNPSPLVVDPSRPTVAGVLKRQGYATACIGKWHLGFGSQPKPDWNAELKPGPLECGFDHYFGIPVVSSHPPFVLVENRRVLGLDPADPLVYGGTPPTQPFPEKMMAPAISGGKAAHALYRDEELGTLLTEKAVGWMREHKGAPFLLYFATPHIHHPFTPHARFKGTSGCGRYGDYIHELDWMVGGVLRALDELGLAGETLVVLTSDNGGMLNQGGQDAWRAGHRLNGDLLGFKFDAWEGGHRVPFIARWPGKIEAGSTSGQLICHVDLLATLAALTGAALVPGDGPDSVNVLEALLGVPGKSIRDELVLAPSRRENLALRQGRWVYIGARGGGGFAGKKPGEHALGGPAALAFTGEINSDIEGGQFRADAPDAQLYDLVTDPSQAKNVIREHPDVAARLKARLAEIQDGPRGRDEIGGKGQPRPRRPKAPHPGDVGQTFLSAVGHPGSPAQAGLPAPRLQVSKGLRAAIEDIGKSFPDYPAQPFLRRLTEWERQRAGLADIPGDGVAGARSRLAADYRALEREALLANPLVSGQPIVFTTRRQYAKDHHNTETIFVTGECNTSKYAGGGALKAIDLADGGAVRTIADAGETGLPRDPDVHFDGKRILFSMRRGIDDDYHICEVNADGSGLRQLTRLAGAADIDPIYLPDGGIVFSSTREPKYCGCNQHIMANLYRMDGDGANIIRIGGSTLFEGHSRLLPDGRILYDRWEYVDRNFGDAQGLWTVNPDGTGHGIYWGNNTPSPGGVIAARPIPGTDTVVAVLGSCHDRPWGALGIIDRRRGIDADAQGRSAILRTWPTSAMEFVGNGGIDTFTKVRPRYQDPYPLSEKYFLCAREIGDADRPAEGPVPEMGIYLVDVFGNETLVHAEEPGCYSPVPLVPRPRPPVLPVRRDYSGGPATVYVMDAYQGTHMRGVERGDIRWLRVVESPEKRHWTVPAWGGQGVHRPAMNWHNFENKRILGTVPVEADGSVLLEIPSDKFVFFQLLDDEGRMIHSMRSGVVFQSGERASCIGCHENRLAPPPIKKDAYRAMAGKAPATLDGWRGPARLYGYLDEVQPVWDRHCVSCHDFEKPAGSKLVLAGDRDLFFNASYESLHQRWRKPDGYLMTVGAGPAEIQQAFSWGSHPSPLVAHLRKGHEDVRLTDEDWDRIHTWLDLNAPYYPTYATAFPAHPGGRSPLDDNEIRRLGELTGIDFRESAKWDKNPGPLVSFDRPHLSPCLARLDGASEAYREALAIIRVGAERLKASPRGDTLVFEPCEMDRAREAKYQARQALESRNRAAIREGRKVYDPPSPALAASEARGVFTQDQRGPGNAQPR